MVVIKMKISPGQALLILINKYKEDPNKFEQLKKLYLSGITDDETRTSMHSYLQDEALDNYKVCFDHNIITNDNTRRYFETHLSYHTLSSQLENITLNELENYLDCIINSAPPEFGNMLWDYVFTHQNPFAFRDPEEREYGVYLHRLNSKSIFDKFSDEKRKKIATLVKISFITIQIASAAPDLLPLNIYGEGVYDQGARGKIAKTDQQKTGTSAYGLLKGHMPLAKTDVAFMDKPQSFLKPSDQATYDVDSSWVEDNFAHLVHPFSNSISGTMLCQLRMLLNIKNILNSSIIDESSEYGIDKDKLQNALDKLKVDTDGDEINSIPLSKEKMATYFTTFIAALVFNAGGHTLYEFVAPMTLDIVKQQFTDIDASN